MAHALETEKEGNMPCSSINVKFGKYRPQISPAENPLAWWEYIYKIIISDVEERKKKWHWDYIGDRANARENYIRMYKKLKLQGEEKVGQPTLHVSNTIQDDAS